MEIQFVSHYIFWYLLITLIGAAVGIWSYRATFPPLKEYQRIFLAVTRTIMIILLGIFLIEPLLNFHSEEKIEPKLAILMDVSKSMSVKDSAVSRMAQADELVSEALKNIKADYRVFDFASNLQAVDKLPSEKDIAGDATSLANAFQGFSGLDNIDDFGAIVVVTDGHQNLGEDPVGVASKLNIPVHTLTLGQMVHEKNLALVNIVYPAVAYSGADFKIEVEISASGIKAGKSRAYIHLGSSVIADKAFDIPEEGRTVGAAFDIKAPEPGNYEYKVSTPGLEGEINQVDNERVFDVRVLKNKLKVFLGSPAIDWEFKYVKQALAQFEEFEVDAVYPEGAGNFSEPGTPRGLDGLKKYDIVILCNGAPANLRIGMPDLKKYIEGGRSLIYLAGSDSPEDIRLFEGILPVKPISPKIVKSEFFFEPSPIRKQHAAIMLGEDPDQSVRTWHSLPPFSDLLTGIAATGEVLLEAGTGSHNSLAPGKEQDQGDSAARPVLTVGNYGKGRVAAITGFPLWKSYFGAVRDQKTAKVVPDFWRSLIRWASATDQADNFRIVTDRKVYRLGEPVRFTGYLFDESSRPRNGAYVLVSLFPGNQETSVKDVVLLPADAGIYSEAVASLAPGKYKFVASATAFNDTLGRTSGEFTIENFSLEMASNSPDYNLTRRISDATGGNAYNDKDFNLFPRQLTLNPYIKESQATFRPFGRPLLLGILLLGLCLEWGLRKKYRLP